MPWRERAKHFLGGSSKSTVKIAAATKPAKQGSNLGADAIEGPAQLHTGPSASSRTGEDWRPNHLLNKQPGLEQETTDDLTLLHASPAVSSSAEHQGLEKLWDEAYKLLQKKDAKLIDAYEKDLLASQDPGQQDASDDRAFSGRNQTSSVGDAGSGDREVQLQKLVDRKLQDIQNAQLKISVNGKSSSLESRSLFLNPITQDEDAVEGLGYISDLLIRRKVIADTYLETCTPESAIPVQSTIRVGQLNCEPLSLTALAGLLGLREELINQRLRHLRSVIHVPESSGLFIRLLHLSFRDFLIDEQRCCVKDFWVDEKTAHESKLMDTCLKGDICSLHAPDTLASEDDRSRLEDCLPPEVYPQLSPKALPPLTLAGHTSSVNAVAFSHDSRRLASASNDYTVRLWDAKMGAHQSTLAGHTSFANAVAFSQDGRRLASTSRGLTVRLWDAEKGTHQSTLEGHTDWVSAVTFSHDGQRLASASHDRTVPLWDVETGVHRSTLEGHTDLVNAVAFSHDGQRLASASNDYTVRLWDARMGTHQSRLAGHKIWAYAIVFSHDGRRLASASHDHTMRLWDAETGTPQSTLRGHTGIVKAVAFSQDARRLASASDDRTVRLWDVETGVHQSTLKGHIGTVKAVVNSLDR